MRIIKLLSSAVFLFCIGLISVKAQHSTSVLRSNASSNIGYLRYSIREILYATNTVTNGSVTQAMPQTYEITVLARVLKEEIHLSISSYANSTNDLLTLRIDGDRYNKNSLASLYDMQGRHIKTNEIDDILTVIPIKGVDSTVFLLKIINSDKVVKTFKIIKSFDTRKAVNHCDNTFKSSNHLAQQRFSI